MNAGYFRGSHCFYSPLIMSYFACLGLITRDNGRKYKKGPEME